MHTFKISALIQFFVSSTCYEHLVFTISETICTCSVSWFIFLAEIKINLISAK
jgi:hypothetical protein